MVQFVRGQRRRRYYNCGLAQPIILVRWGSHDGVCARRANVLRIVLRVVMRAHLVEPASRQFSSISFTAEAGRCTTSPAAMRLTTVSSSRWMCAGPAAGGASVMVHDARQRFEISSVASVEAKKFRRNFFLPRSIR